MIELPIKEPFKASLMLILYRWQDKYYEQVEIRNSNDAGAVVAMVEVINELLVERYKK